jgi:hypothetical protein
MMNTSETRRCCVRYMCATLILLEAYARRWMPEGELSAVNYLRWLSTEISSLLNLFGGVNENFITAAIEGALVMASES